MRNEVKKMAYMTVGNEIDVRLVLKGNYEKFIEWPTVGHIKVPFHPEDKIYKGSCPWHGNCVEGLCNNVSIA